MFRRSLYVVDACSVFSLIWRFGSRFEKKNCVSSRKSNRLVTSMNVCMSTV